MTQLFSSTSTSSPSAVTTEKRGTFAWKHSNETGHIQTKIKNFFRINSSSSTHHGTGRTNGTEAGRDGGNHQHFSSPGKTESRSAFRSGLFFPVIGRNRSTTVASEGNMLDDGISPTATANPYFAHQGQPALQHRNEGSVPSSPPGTPELQVHGVSAAEQASTANKQELARKLRRVASAPNTQGLFANTANGVQVSEVSKDSSVDSDTVHGTDAPTGTDDSLAVPAVGPGSKLAGPGQHKAGGGSFRRTYSSTSIKVSNVEVGPGSFDKIKLIGKGDVGKVYLVREKKSSRLYAMKGGFASPPKRWLMTE